MSIAPNGNLYQELQSITCHTECYLPSNTGEHAQPQPKPDKLAPSIRY